MIHDVSLFAGKAPVARGGCTRARLCASSAGVAPSQGGAVLQLGCQQQSHSGGRVARGARPGVWRVGPEVGLWSAWRTRYQPLVRVPAPAGGGCPDVLKPEGARRAPPGCVAELDSCAHFFPGEDGIWGRPARLHDVHAQGCPVGGPRESSRIALGRETLLLQGFPTSRVPIDAFPESLLQDLAGNAMAVPVVLAVLMASFCAIHWRDATAEDAPAATQADVDVSLAAYELSLEGIHNLGSLSSVSGP